MKCSQCNIALDDNTRCEHLGQILCEDCYMEALSPVKTCDPWAVYTAQRFEVNQKEPPKLSPLQDRILEIITQAGQIEADAILAQMQGQLTRSDLEREFATLRHMGKAGARKSGDTVLYLAG